MSRTIWKYALTPHHGEAIEMPAGATIVHVGQNPADSFRPAIWMLVNPDAPLEPRGFATFGTGDPITSDPRYVHVGSAVCDRLPVLRRLHKPQAHRSGVQRTWRRR